MVQIEESVPLFQSGTPLNKPEGREQTLNRQQLHLAHLWSHDCIATALQPAGGHACHASEVRV